MLPEGLIPFYLQELYGSKHFFFNQCRLRVHFIPPLKYPPSGKGCPPLVEQPSLVLDVTTLSEDSNSSTNQPFRLILSMEFNSIQ